MALATATPVTSHARTSRLNWGPSRAHRRAFVPSTGAACAHGLNKDNEKNSAPAYSGTSRASAVNFAHGLLATSAGVILTVSPAMAGPLSDLLPDSAPPAPPEKFERDLGEGRKMRVKDGVPPKDTEVGRLPAPLPYAKAQRAGVETESDPGGLPGVGKEFANSSVAAPLSYSKPRSQS